MIIALAIGIVHRQQLSRQQTFISPYQTDYSQYSADSNINIQPTFNTQNNDSSTAKPAMIWQLLPWLVMLLISIGFYLWWQDIHIQILRALAAGQ